MQEHVSEQKTGNADSILVEMFNVIKHDLNISTTIMESAIERFSTKAKDSSDLKKLQGAKSNFISALGKNQMTFKTFHRGMVIIGANKYTLTVTGKRKDGVTASCSGSVKVSIEDFLDPSDDKVDLLLITMFKMINHVVLENTSDFTKLFEDYAILTGVPMDPIARAKERASLKKDLFRAKKISWKNFIKGLLFLGFVEFDVTMKICHKNGKTTTHIRKIILRDEDD